MKTPQNYKFRYDLAACALLEALYTTDADACAKYGISIRTLRNYRHSLAINPKLADLFREKKAALDAQWAEVLPGAMREAAQAIQDISKSIRTDPIARKNPFALEKLAGALKLCADVYYTGKVIDARIAGQNRPQDELPGEGAAEAEGDHQYPM